MTDAVRIRPAVAADADDITALVVATQRTHAEETLVFAAPVRRT